MLFCRWANHRHLVTWVVDRYYLTQYISAHQVFYRLYPFTAMLRNCSYTDGQESIPIKDILHFKYLWLTIYASAASLNIFALIRSFLSLPLSAAGLSSFSHHCTSHQTLYQKGPSIGIGSHCTGYCCLYSRDLIGNCTAACHLPDKALQGYALIDQSLVRLMH